MFILDWHLVVVSNSMYVTIVGTGYVGLSTGACLSHLGNLVTCLDVDAHKIDLLQQGEIPIVEEGLSDLVVAGLANNSLIFTTDKQKAVVDAEVVFLCLPTPQGEDGSADLSHVRGAVDELRNLLKPRAILVNKSTVPVGTAGQIRSLLGRDDVAVVSNPEFLRQGTAVQDFLNPSRVVVGGSDSVAVETVISLYEKIDAPKLRMKTESAEALKYAANAFLATKLTFINAMADICEAVGADIFDVASGIGLDPRIGADMLQAGPGWGGSCFPKDTRALVSIAADNGYDFALLRDVIETNEKHYRRIADKIIAECGGSVEGRVIAAWGLTFKANTDDLRDSPAIKILTLLHDSGASVHAYDPTATKPYPEYPWIVVTPTAESACAGADLLAVLTEWSEFGEKKPADIAPLLKHARVVDGRNALNRDEWLKAGFSYRGVGR